MEGAARRRWRTRGSEGSSKYVEDALEHLLKGEFAPRSDKNVETSTRSFSIPVVAAEDPDADPKSIVVPDVTGELWKKAVETSEMPQQWMDSLRASDGAMIFLRVHSEQNVEPLNWVTCAALLCMQGARDPDQETEIPTQVALCELLRFLETTLSRREDRKQFEHYIRAAAGVAKDAAPYLHSRFSTIDQSTANIPDKIIVEVRGGLPVGSTPERPEGTEYSDVPPEEPNR